jgi:hypothetical protein
MRDSSFLNRLPPSLVTLLPVAVGIGALVLVVIIGLVFLSPPETIEDNKPGDNGDPVVLVDKPSTPNQPEPKDPVEEVDPATPIDPAATDTAPTVSDPEVSKPDLRDPSPSNPEPTNLTPSNPVPSNPPSPAKTFDLAKVVDASYGYIGDEVAFCQTLAYEDFLRVNDEMGKLGLSTTSLRVWSAKDELKVSATWEKNGWETEIRMRFSGKEFIQENAKLIARNLVPYDISCWLDESGEHTYAGVWAKSGDEAAKYRICLTTRNDDFVNIYSNWVDEGYKAVRLVVFYDNKEEPDRMCTAIFMKSGARYFRVNAVIPSNLQVYLERWKYASDVHVTRYPKLPTGPGPKYFLNGIKKSIYMAELEKTEILSQLSLPAHRDRCRELAESGYKPRSVVAAWTTDDNYFTLSLWHKK